MPQWRIYVAPPALEVVDAVRPQRLEATTKTEAAHHRSSLSEKSHDFIKMHTVPRTCTGDVDAPRVRPVTTLGIYALSSQQSKAHR